MKRRFFSLLFTLVVLCAYSIALSEGNTVAYQYGISFGDDLLTLIYNLPYPGQYWGEYYSEGVKINGIENSCAAHCFDKNEKLNSVYIEYNVSSGVTEISRERDWYFISNMLMKEYGLPDNDDIYNHMGYLTPSLNTSLQVAEEDRKTLGYVNIAVPYYEEWLLPHGEDYVKIEHYMVYSQAPLSGRQFKSHVLTYLLVSSADIHSSMPNSYK